MKKEEIKDLIEGIIDTHLEDRMDLLIKSKKAFDEEKFAVMAIYDREIVRVSDFIDQLELLIDKIEE